MKPQLNLVLYEQNKEWKSGIEIVFIVWYTLKFDNILFLSKYFKLNEAINDTAAQVEATSLLQRNILQS